MAYEPSKCTECGESGHAWWDHDLPKGFKFGEEPLEAYMDDNLSEEPGGVEITTRGQRRAIMRRNNIEYRKNKFEGEGRRMYFDMRK